MRKFGRATWAMALAQMRANKSFKFSETELKVIVTTCTSAAGPRSASQWRSTRQSTITARGAAQIRAGSLWIRKNPRLAG